MGNECYYLLRFMALAGMIAITFSCEYRDYADAEYVGQQIYMPAANHNIYEVNEVFKKPGVHPTEGIRYRFQIDEGNNSLIIPLGVFRGGIDRQGKVNVDILINIDTISYLISQSTLDSTVLVLPEEQVEVPLMVVVEDGDDFQGFDLKVDLNFLRNMHLQNPAIKYAIGVGISSESLPVNEELRTTLVLIDPKITTP